MKIIKMENLKIFKNLSERIISDSLCPDAFFTIKEKVK